MNFKEGDKITLVNGEKIKITEISNLSSTYPILVKYEDGRVGSRTLEGRFSEDYKSDKDFIIAKEKKVKLNTENILESITKLIEENKKLKIENKNLRVETPKEMIELLSENHFEDMLKEVKENVDYLFADEDELVEAVTNSTNILYKVITESSDSYEMERTLERADMVLVEKSNVYNFITEEIENDGDLLFDLIEDYKEKLIDILRNRHDRLIYDGISDMTNDKVALTRAFEELIDRAQ